MTEDRKDRRAIGLNISYYRKAKGLTQEQLGNMLYITRQHMSRIETNKNEPTLDLLYRIADVLQVPVEALLKDNTEVQR